MLLAKNLTRIQMKLQCCLYTVPSYPTFHSLNSSNRNGIEMRSCSSLYSIPFATAHDLTTFCSNPVPGESFYKFFQKKKNVIFSICSHIRWILTDLVAVFVSFSWMEKQRNSPNICSFRDLMHYFSWWSDCSQVSFSLYNYYFYWVIITWKEVFYIESTQT